MSQTRLGYLYGVLAYLCWGLFPLYWRLLRPSGPLELLAHRVVWSLVCVLAVVAATRTWRRVGTLLRPRMLGTIAVAAVLIAVNWGTYIYGVNAERVVETSLGYFINPLVTVLLGVLVLGERLTRAQWVAISVGAVAVIVLTVDYGRPPWIALVLAASFGLYGLTKKRLAAMGGEGGVPAADGLTLESAVLAVPAAGYLVVLGLHGGSTVGHVSAAHTTLAVASGVVTAVPLLAFAGAANRIPLSGIGLLQYLAPILQLGCGVLILHEPMPPARLAGFALVWLALAVFTWDAVRRLRSATRSSIAAAIPPAPVADVPAGR
jgi:chloramphenicol-sensitive protein RarD